MPNGVVGAVRCPYTAQGRRGMLGGELVSARILVAEDDELQSRLIRICTEEDMLLGLDSP